MTHFLQTTQHQIPRTVSKLSVLQLQATPEKERAALVGTLAPLRAAAEPHAGGPAAYARHTALQVLALCNRDFRHPTHPYTTCHLLAQHEQDDAYD